jgi:hypothetical protein
LGTNSSNYNEWRISGTNLAAGEMEVLAFIVGDASHGGSTGTGWDPSAITYVVVGYAFNNETDTLTGILFDEISYHTNSHVSASIQSEVTSSVSSSNVNIQKVGNQTTNTNTGNAGNGTLRVAVATDDVNLSAISAAFASEGAALGDGVLLQGDDGTDRKNINVDATTGDVQVDVTNTVTVSGTVTADAGTGPWPVTDNGGSLTVDNGGTFAVQVDAALPAGTNNIGDVDVVSSALPTGAATAANQLPDGHNVTPFQQALTTSVM